MKLSVAIPTSKMPNGKNLLIRCLDSLWNQSFQNFEIIVTDNSDDSELYDVCNSYGLANAKRGFSDVGIKYFLNPVKGMAQNTNEAIRQSKGELIKIIYMDDYLAHKDSLWKIVSHFEGHWLVTGCLHDDGLDVDRPHMPHYSDDIHTGNNTIGSPSVLTIRNRDPMLFDESLQWLLDCDYYRRMHDRWGDPVILKDKNVVLGLHPGQMTHTMGDQRKIDEYNYMINKYKQ